MRGGRGINQQACVEAVTLGGAELLFSLSQCAAAAALLRDRVTGTDGCCRRGSAGAVDLLLRVVATAFVRQLFDGENEYNEPNLCFIYICVGCLVD